MFDIMVIDSNGSFQLTRFLLLFGLVVNKDVLIFVMSMSIFINIAVITIIIIITIINNNKLVSILYI